MARTRKIPTTTTTSNGKQLQQHTKKATKKKRKRKNDEDSNPKSSKIRKFDLKKLIDVQGLFGEIFTSDNQSKVLSEIKMQWRSNKNLETIQLSSHKDMIKDKIIQLVYSVIDEPIDEIGPCRDECDCLCHNWGGSGCQACYYYEIHDVSPLVDLIQGEIGNFDSALNALTALNDSGRFEELVNFEPKTSGDKDTVIHAFDGIPGSKIREAISEMLNEISCALAEYYTDDVDKEQVNSLLKDVSGVLGEDKFDKLFSEIKEKMKR